MIIVLAEYTYDAGKKPQMSRIDDAHAIGLCMESAQCLSMYMRIVRQDCGPDVIWRATYIVSCLLS